MSIVMTAYIASFKRSRRAVRFHGSLVLFEKLRRDAGSQGLIRLLKIGRFGEFRLEAFEAEIAFLRCR